MGIGNSRRVGGGGGGGNQRPRKFQRGGGVNGLISFQRANFMFVSDSLGHSCSKFQLTNFSFLKTSLRLTALQKLLLH